MNTGLRRDPLAWAIGLWLLLAAVIGVRTLASPERHTVFPIFAGSADHWWADQSLYELHPPLDQFRYPPLFAVAITPFAMLGLRFGGLLWSWGSIAVYVVGVTRMREGCPARAMVARPIGGLAGAGSGRGPAGVVERPEQHAGGRPLAPGGIRFGSAALVDNGRSARGRYLDEADPLGAGAAAVSALAAPAGPACSSLFWRAQRFPS